MGSSASHLIHDSLGSPDSASQTASRSVQPFCTAHGRASLYCRMGRPLTQKLSISMGDMNPYVTHGFLGPPEYTTQTASRSVQPFLHGSQLYCDIPTDRPIDHDTTLRVYSVYNYTMSQKSSHLSVVCNFVKSWQIFKTFTLVESVWNLLQNLYDNTHLTFGMLLHYLRKLEVQIFCRRVWKKRKQIAFLIASIFVVHQQILIFSVFKIATLSLYWL